MPKSRRRLRVLRAEVGITQRKLAIKARLSPSRYWQIESGEGAPASSDERARIAAVLGVSTAEIEWPSIEEVRAS